MLIPHNLEERYGNIMFGGLHSTVDSILASRPAAPVSILGVPKIFSENILDVVEIYWQRALLRQWTVQSLIVDQTHPVLVRAVLHKQKINNRSPMTRLGQVLPPRGSFFLSIVVKVASYKPDLVAKRFRVSFVLVIWKLLLRWSKQAQTISKFEILPVTSASSQFLINV